MGLNLLLFLEFLTEKGILMIAFRLHYCSICKLRALSKFWSQFWAYQRREAIQHQPWTRFVHTVQKCALMNMQ